MADNSGLIIKVGIFGAVAYYAYSQGWLSSLGIGTATTTVATTPATQAAIAGTNTLSAVQAATILQANAPAAGLAVDDWGWYLNNVLAPLGKTAPDPMPIFTAAVPGFVRSQLLTSAQYWAVMAPALTSQLGLSGLGLYRRIS